MRDKELAKEKKATKGFKCPVRLSVYGVGLFIIGLLSYQGLKVYKVIQRQNVEASNALEIDETRKLDAVESLKKAEAALGDGDLDVARVELRKAKGLDIEGKHSGLISELKAKYDSALAIEKDRAAKEETIRLDVRRRMDAFEKQLVGFNSLNQEGLLNSTFMALEKSTSVLGDEFSEELKGIQSRFEGKKVSLHTDHLKKLVVKSKALTNSGELEQLKSSIVSIEKVVQVKGVEKELVTESKELLKSLGDRARQLELEAKFTGFLNTGDWSKAEVLLGEISGQDPLGVADDLRKRMEGAKLAFAERQKKITVLLEEVKGMDDGHFNKEALIKLDELLDMDPENDVALALRSKLKGYSRVLRVPGDFSSLDEAVAEMKDGDRLVLGEGVHYVSLKISKAIVIEGAGVDKTVLETDGDSGSALYLDHKSGQVKISNLKIMGKKYIEGEERHALLLVAGDVLMEDCEVERAAGHGIALISGRLDMNRCKVSNSGWDGVTVKGAQSHVVLTDCLVMKNSEHGVDFWDGGVGTVFRSKVENNAKSGIVVTGTKSRVTVSNVTVSGNRDAGLFLADGALVHIDRLVVRGNSFSGVVVQDAGTRVKLSGVNSSDNGEAGYVVDPNSIVEGLGVATGSNNGEGLVVRKRLKQ